MNNRASFLEMFLTFVGLTLVAAGNSVEEKVAIRKIDSVGQN